MIDPAYRRQWIELGEDPAELDALDDLHDPDALTARLAALEAVQVEAQASDVEWLARVESQFPLVTCTLWQNPDVLCDQRRTVVQAMTAPEVTVILGGERSGKSEGQRQLTLAQALGGDHPAVIAWCALNGLPQGVIPDGPGRVYYIAQESNSSVRNHRPWFDKHIGTGKSWYGKNYKGEGRVTIEVPGYPQLAEIWFKSVEQGADAFQSDSIRWWGMDEEPLGDDGLGVFGQLRARAMDQQGRGSIAMVPWHGFTWVHDDLVRDRKYDAITLELDVLDNPHLPEARAARHVASFKGAELEIRRFGRFTSREGNVYETWGPGDGSRDSMGHVCDEFPIPPDWPRFRGADFGIDNPTCVLWGALGDDHTLYVYREYYERGATYEEHGRAVKALSRGERYGGSWGDPSSKTVLEETWPLLDVYFDKANRELRAGIDAVRNRLRLRSDNRPRLKVFRSCVNLIREMGVYRRDPNAKDGEPVKKDDHAPDALRYMVMGIDGLYGPRG